MPGACALAEVGAGVWVEPAVEWPALLAAAELPSASARGLDAAVLPQAARVRSARMARVERMARAGRDVRG